MKRQNILATMLTMVLTMILMASAACASMPITGITLTNPEENSTFTANTASMPVQFNFNVTTGNESIEFTESLSLSMNTTCDLIVNGTSYSNATSGMVLDIAIGEYAWNAACAASGENSTSETGVEKKFRITSLPLILNATATPITGIGPLTVQFSAIAGGGIPQYYYLWNFGDGMNGTALQNTLYYTYYQTGTYNATVQVKDSANQTIQKYFMIIVERQHNFSSSVVMDKQEYIVGENAHISIDAPLNTTVQLRFFKAGAQVDSMDFVHSIQNSDYIYLLYPPYPISNPGNYTLKAYLTYDGATNNHSADFKVKNLDAVLPLSASIIVDSTTVDAGSDVALRSSVSGGIPPYSYEWDVQNDGTLDSTSVDTSARFNIGNYTIKLIVKDSNNTQYVKTIVMNSKEPMYRVVAVVSDSYKNTLIENADVTFAGIMKNTGGSGSVEYSLKGGNYTLKAAKEGYFAYETSFELKGELTLSIKLNSTTPYADTTDALSVNILNPTSAAGSAFSIRYKATGVDPECTLFIKEDGWWASKGKQSGIGEKSFQTSLEKGDYQYKVECAENGTTVGSQAYTVKISENIVQTIPTGQVGSDNPDAQALFEWIDEAIETFSNLDVEEKKAADSMNIRAFLDGKRKDVERIARDIADLKYLTGTSAQIEERRLDLNSRLRTIKGEIPKNIEVLDSAEFVKYPRTEDIKILLSEMRKSNDTDSVDQLLKSQEKVSVLTDVKKIRMTYYYFDPQEFIIIDKILTKKDNLENYSFIEVIPKTLAKTAKDITFQNTYKLIKDDPIVDIDISKGEKVTYYFKSEAEISEAENIISALMEKKSSGVKKSGLLSATGFSIRKLVPVKISDTTLFLEVTAIIVLIIAYIAYSYSDELKNIISSGESQSHNGKNTEYMRKLIGETMDNIERWNVEKAYMNYEEIKLLYKSLSSTDKGIVYEEIVKIASQINAKHAEKLIDEAFDLLRAGEKEKAVARYKDVQDIYSSLPEDFKEKLHERSMHLYDAIAA